MGQLTYALELSAGFEGQISDSRLCQIDGRRNDAGAELAFGRAVSKSANADNLGMKLPALNEVLLGILVHGMDNEKTVTGLPSLEMGNVLSRGRAWVKVENAVTPASQVLIRIDSGGNGAGSFRGGAAVDDSLVAVPQARFLGSAGINELVEVDVNFPAIPALT